MSSVKRTSKEWTEFCTKNYKGGYAPEGRAAYIYESGVILAALLKKWGVPIDDQRIVDVGCGNCRLALGLLDSNIKHYVGLDVIKASIEFCKLALADDKRFMFHHLDTQNAAYNPSGAFPPELTAYPLSNESFDVVIANSLFSHTETAHCARTNLAEMQRVLHVGGTLFSTWRLVPPYKAADTSARHTNYLRDDVLSWLDEYGFKIEREITGLPREIKVDNDSSQIGFVAKREK